MPYHARSSSAALDQNTITKPKIIKNWAILGGCVLGIGLCAFWLLWPREKPDAGPTAPAPPPNPLSAISAPRDDAVACKLLGVSPDGRFVVGTWRQTKTPEQPALAEDRPAIDGKLDFAGIEVWDRRKNTRIRKNCVDEVYFDPAGSVIILQELSKSSVVHRVDPETGTASKVLDSADYKDYPLVYQGGRRLFVSTDGRLGVAFGKKPNGETALVQWDLTTGKLAHCVKIGSPCELVGVANDGKRAAVRIVDKKLVEIWDMAAGKVATTSSIGNQHFAAKDVFLKQSPFLADHRTLALRLYNLPENDANARWTWEHFDPDTGKLVELGSDDYALYDSGSGLWLRARDGLVRQTSWELVKKLGRDAPIHARLSLSHEYKVRRACFVPGKGQLACYFEVESTTPEYRRLIQVFDTRSGNLFGEVSRPNDIDLDGHSLLATANGAGLLFLSKLGKEDRLEMWRITPRPKPTPLKKPSKDKDKVAEPTKIA